MRQRPLLGGEAVIGPDAGIGTQRKQLDAGVGKILLHGETQGGPSLAVLRVERTAGIGEQTACAGIIALGYRIEKAPDGDTK